MAAPRSTPRGEPTGAPGATGARHSGGVDAVVRRAPFSNTRIAARGLRTQQRIVDAALQAFGDEGYHRCSVEQITKLGGCSRVSFYQYFASKEDVFRHLAGQVDRQLEAATEALDPLTADRQGWLAMRAWVARYAAIYARYQPVFNAYQTAVESDEVIASAGGRLGEQNIARIQSRLAPTTLSPRELEPVVRMLLECLTHTLDVTGLLRSAVPGGYPSERVVDAVTDVVHRTLFGRREAVNVHPPAGAPSPALELAPAMLNMLRQGDETPAASASPKGALAALLASGRDVFVRRGYHNTRVDDLVSAAGISRGAFYRYFRDKGELARVLTARAVRGIGATLIEIPDVVTIDATSSSSMSTARRALRRWLRRYNAAHVTEAAMLRVWVDGALQHPVLRAESAPPLDWGRARMAHYLRPRGFGDVDMEAVVMVALLGVFGARQRPAAEVEAAAHIIERGLLGR